MEMVEVNTTELTGEALGWAVGESVGHELHLHDPKYGSNRVVYRGWKGEVLWFTGRFDPWQDWAVGGPLVERFAVKLVMLDECDGMAPTWAAEAGAECAWEANPNKYMAQNGGAGDKPLMAACRAIVRARFGNVVQVPKELMP